MLTRSTGTRRRHSRVLWAVLGAVLTVLVLIVLAKARGGGPASEIDRHIRDAHDAQKDRAQQRHAELEQARAALPADAGVPRDWVFAKAIESLLASQTQPRINDVLQVARVLLSGVDPESPAPTPSDRRPPPLHEIRNRIQVGRQSGTLTPLEESIDWTRHSREEVLAAIDRYLSGFSQVTEAEAAYEHGLFVARPLSPDDSANPVSDFTLADVLACRAIFDARRGDLPKAVRSFANAQGMRTEIARTHGILGYRNLWALQLLTDAAWEHASLTQEQRNTILASLPAPASPDQIRDSIYSTIESQRANKDRQILDLRKQFPGQILALYLDYRWNSALNKTGACLQSLRPLLAQPTAQAIPAMEKLAEHYGNQRGFVGVAPSLILSDAARFLYYNALNGLTPDLAKTAFALKDFQREHRKYPATLDGIDPGVVPVLPPEPLTGQPLVYRSDGATFIITLPNTALETKRPRLRLDRAIAALVGDDGASGLWNAR